MVKKILPKTTSENSISYTKQMGIEDNPPQ